MSDQETEVKLLVHDLGRIQKRLQELSARLIQPRVYEVNLRYDLPNNALRGDGKVLRLRMDTQARLTCKGPSERLDGVLHRTEFETTVGDFETAQKILKFLGYFVSATYEKYRSVYEWEKCHIMLDELPYGEFVEIEGSDVEDIQNAAHSLDLDFHAAIPASYLTLFEGLCQKRGLDPSQLTFPALKNHLISAQDLSTSYLQSVRYADES